LVRESFRESRELFRVSNAPLQIEAVIASVTAPWCGAVATFIGTVRDSNAGRRVRWLEYEAYAPLALRSFEQIADEARGRWAETSIAIHHRTGRVEVGESSVVIAAASKHRAAAFAATRYAIERIKQITPIWKHEHFDGGAVWIEGATADPGDEAARQEAFERACS
jgi:molybdopterin synthase catalytic subunit